MPRLVMIEILGLWMKIRKVSMNTDIVKIREILQRFGVRVGLMIVLGILMN